jgi:hypothetical protein
VASFTTGHPEAVIYKVLKWCKWLYINPLTYYKILNIVGFCNTKTQIISFNLLVIKALRLPRFCGHGFPASPSGGQIVNTWFPAGDVYATHKAPAQMIFIFCAWHGMK